MNNDLKIAIDEFTEIIIGIRPNYVACYNSFLSYCNNNLNYGMSELFEKINMFHIEQACKEYFVSSKKAKKVEAIHRFLSAIDMFYSEYLVPREIYCKALEKRCRHKEVVKRICQSLNQDFNAKIYLPLEGNELEESKKLVEGLDSNNFFQLGQKIIFKLLSTYGFKEKVVINMPINAFDTQNKTLTILGEDGVPINLNLSNETFEELKKYVNLNPFPKRNYLFTITNGKQLDSGSILQTLKDRAERKNIVNFTATSIALNGIADLINRNLSISLIKKLSGFETRKIEDVSDYLLVDKDISQLINEKLKQ